MASRVKDTKLICSVCGSFDNFFIQDGDYYCSVCQARNENLKEHALDENYDSTVQIKKMAIKNKSNKTVEENTADSWTTWELYNFILIGLVDQLINLGADPAIKATTLDLWARYLQKLEVAFTSTKKRVVPKLSRLYREKDAGIIYGRQQKKIKRKRKSSSKASSVASGDKTGRALSRQKKLNAEISYENYLRSQGNSDVESFYSSSFCSSSMQSSNASSHENKVLRKFNRYSRREAERIKKLSKKMKISNRTEYQKNHLGWIYKESPELLSVTKLMALLYLALKIHDQDITISDMLRYIREGHLSYYRLDCVLPEGVNISNEDRYSCFTWLDLLYRRMRFHIVKMARFLGVHNFAKPDLGNLIERYCTELQLPNGIMLYAKRLLVLSQPTMKYHTRIALLPNYEGRAMAFIIVSLKILFCLDGITEYEISKLAEEINRVASEKNVLESSLFSFREWQRYIECRRSWLTMLHLPTKVKFDPEYVENNHLYIRFLESMPQKEYSTKKMLSFHIALKMWLDDVDMSRFTVKNAEVFPASKTSMHNNLQLLLNNPLYDLPDILKVNFTETKVEYMTKPHKLENLAMQCELQLTVLNSNLNFIEKMVAPFAHTMAKAVKIPQRKVAIEICKTSDAVKTENVLEYLQNKERLVIKVNEEKQRLIESVKISNPEHSDFQSPEDDDFCFSEIDNTGKLSIANISDSDDESDPTDIPLKRYLFERETNKFVQDHPLFVLPQRYKREKQEPGQMKTKICDFITLDMVKRRRQEQSERDPLSLEDDNQEEAVLNGKYVIERETSEYFNNEVNSSENNRILFRPFKDYWTYQDRWNELNKLKKPNMKHHERLEKELPFSFNWLLKECANTLEMTVSDLYEEVAFVEAYFSCKFESSNKKNKSQKRHRRVYKSLYLKLDKLW